MNVAWNCSFSLSASALSPSNLISSDVTRSTVSFMQSSWRSCAGVADNECKKFHERTPDDGEGADASSNRFIWKILRPVIERICHRAAFSVRLYARRRFKNKY